MKQKLLIAIGIFVSILALSTTTAHALNAQTGDTLTVAKSETIDSSIYRTGKNITIAGTVKGDVFCAGQSIEITGTVEGDVLCAGQTVRVSGVVEGDIRIAGQNVTITGDVRGNATAMGQAVTFEDTAKIGKDLTLAGQTSRLAGTVGRDAVVTGETTAVAGKIGRHLDVYGNDIALKAESRVQGAFTYTSEHTAVVDQGAVVSGETLKKQPAKNEKQNESWTSRMTGPFNWLVAMFVIGGTFLLIAPRTLKETSLSMRKDGFAAAGIGLAGLILTPIAIVLLMISLIGIPLGVGLLFLWITAIICSFAFSAYSLGAWLLAKLPWLEKGRDLAALILGTLLLVLLLNIPFVWFWVGLIALVWGLGGLYMAVWRAVRNQRKPVVKVKKV